MSQGNICPTCGAQNNGDQTHCWQCKSLLLQIRPRGHLTPSSAERSQRRISAIRQPGDERFFRAAFALLLAALIASGYRLYANLQDGFRAPQTMGEFLEDGTFVTRAITGVLLLLLSPVVMGLALRLSAVRPRYSSTRVLLVAIISSATAFCLSWLPLYFWPAIPVVFLVATWALLKRGMSLTTSQTLKSWALYSAGYVAALVVLAWSLESLQARVAVNPAQVASQVRQWHEKGDTKPEKIAIPTGQQAPILTWTSSGSDWLDRRANRVQVQVSPVDRSGELPHITHFQSGRTVANGAEIDGNWLSEPFVPSLESPYGIFFPAGSSNATEITVYGLLPLGFNDSPNGLP